MKPDASGNEARARSKAGRPSLHPTVIALAVVSLLHDLAGDMVTPLLPALLATMGSGPAALGLVEGVDGVEDRLEPLPQLPARIK